MEHPKLYENIMKDKDVISALDYLRERQHGIRTFNLIDMLQKEIPEKDKELTKYKRVLDILKDTIDFNVFCREVKKGDGIEKTYFIIFGEILVKISKEEYELLKEVFGE